MAGDLFGLAAEESRAAHAPLADRLRPHRLEDVVGQDHLVGPGRPLRRWAERGGRGSIVLWGPPGTGKTTLARVLVRACGAELEALSAVSATVADVRRTADAAMARLGERGVRTVLFLDEIHRFTRTQQDALLPHVENGLITLIGATTESPWATVNRPLLSRCTVHELHPLDARALETLIGRAGGALDAVVDADAAALLADSAGGDGRHLLVALEAAVLAAEPADSATGTAHIGVDAARTSLGAGVRHYDAGAHFDAASALIKHLRNSDADQAMAWMLHMLDGGEDPRFIARRLVVFASEDVGPAEPVALATAVAASRAVESVGLPECRYNLAHAVLVLARASKSREVGAAMTTATTVELLPPPAR